MKRRLLIKCANVFALYNSGCASYSEINNFLELYVSPNKNNNGDGTILNPYNSIEFALTKIKGDTKLILMSGTHKINSSIIINNSSKKIIIKSIAGETAIISGAFEYNFNTTQDYLNINIFHKMKFDQIYVNDQPKKYNRFPHDGYLYINKDSELNLEKKYDRLYTNKDDMQSEFIEDNETQVVFFQIWSCARFTIKEFDVKNGVIYFNGQTIGGQPYQAPSKGGRYYIDNFSHDLMDDRWFYKKSTNTITYRSIKKINGEHISIKIPEIEKLLLVNNSKNITFENITFECTGWMCGNSGQSFFQSDVNLGAAIEISKSSNIKFTGCTIRNVGAWAIEIKEGSEFCIFDKCTIIGTGAGAIKIGGQQFQSNEMSVVNNISVTNCKILDGGIVHKSACAIWIGHSHNNNIKNNLIDNYFYTAISIGWVWGYGNSNAHNNLIYNNLIKNIGNGILSDMAGIYTLGKSSGTIIKNNIIHNVRAFNYGGFGIYLDEGSSDIMVESNIVYNCSSAGFHLHYGINNKVINNIFSNNEKNEVVYTKISDKIGFIMEGNIFYSKNIDVFSRKKSQNYVNYIFRGNYFYIKNNLSPRDSDLFIGEVIDPGFINADEGNFELPIGSNLYRHAFNLLKIKDVGPK